MTELKKILDKFEEIVAENPYSWDYGLIHENGQRKIRLITVISDSCYYYYLVKAKFKSDDINKFIPDDIKKGINIEIHDFNASRADEPSNRKPILWIDSLIEMNDFIGKFCILEKVQNILNERMRKELNIE